MSSKNAAEPLEAAVNEESKAKTVPKSEAQQLTYAAAALKPKRTVKKRGPKAGKTEKVSAQPTLDVTAPLGKPTLKKASNASAKQAPPQPALDVIAPLGKPRRTWKKAPPAKPAQLPPTAVIKTPAPLATLATATSIQQPKKTAVKEKPAAAHSSLTTVVVKQEAGPSTEPDQPNDENLSPLEIHFLELLRQQHPTFVDIDKVKASMQNVDTDDLVITINKLSEKVSLILHLRAIIDQ